MKAGVYRIFSKNVLILIQTERVISPFPDLFSKKYLNSSIQTNETPRHVFLFLSFEL